MICSVFFILTLTLSCGDQQSSTNEDREMEDAAIEELMAGFTDEENQEDEVDLDGENRRSYKRRSRADKKRKSKGHKAASDVDSFASTGPCVKGASDYLDCKYHESRTVTDTAKNTGQSFITTYETYNCLPTEDKKEFLNEKVQILLVEYSYKGVTPKDALLCEVQSMGEVLGYAHHTQGFCRDNQSSRLEPDSLNEALEEYKRLGYQCTKEEDLHLNTTKKDVPGTSATDIPLIAPASRGTPADTNASPRQQQQPAELEKPPWVEE